MPTAAVDEDVQIHVAVLVENVENLQRWMVAKVRGVHHPLHHLALCPLFARAARISCSAPVVGILGDEEQSEQRREIPMFHR